MAAVDDPFVRGIEDFECRHNLACGQRFNLQRSAAKLVDAFGKVLEVFLKRQTCRPSRLKLEHTRRRCLRLHTGKSGGADRSGKQHFEEAFHVGTSFGLIGNSRG